MIVCLCEAVSDRTIRAAVESGANTVGAIARHTRAGTQCGSCACDLAKLLKESAHRVNTCVAACIDPDADAADPLPLAAK